MEVNVGRTTSRKKKNCNKKLLNSYQSFTMTEHTLQNIKKIKLALLLITLGMY